MRAGARRTHFLWRRILISGRPLREAAYIDRRREVRKDGLLQKAPERKGPTVAAAGTLRGFRRGHLPIPALLPQAGGDTGRRVSRPAGTAGGGLLSPFQRVVTAVKVVVVKSPKFLAGILRFLFKIKKEDGE